MMKDNVMRINHDADKRILLVFDVTARLF